MMKILKEGESGFVEGGHCDREGKFVVGKINVARKMYLKKVDKEMWKIEIEGDKRSVSYEGEHFWEVE